MKFIIILIIELVFYSNTAFSQKKERPTWLENTIKVAQKQYTLLYAEANKNSDSFPRTTKVENGKVVLKSTEAEDWTPGFFPGALWYLFELSKDNAWKYKAIEWTNKLDSIQFFYAHHDVGFMIYCSYGTGYRLAANPYYENVIVNAAKSLIKRYRPSIGAIQSWDLRGWQGKRGWQCPIIIDNMMNLELLLKASQITKNDTFKNIAIAHTDKTLLHHFREDNSCYHVVDYDTISGLPKHKITAQGYSDESDWARGQAWALYGYTYMYRETKQQKYLDQAKKIFIFLSQHKNMPADGIPYWDLKAKSITDKQATLKDASAAAIIASALLELSHYGTTEENNTYFKYADKILQTLSSAEYLAAEGTNTNFILKHSVGSVRHNQEIDEPLIYADYYFLEALARYKYYKP